MAHYPSYAGSELREGGYAGVTKIIVVGGTWRIIELPDSGETINVGNPKNPAISILGADAVYLIAACGRTHAMGAYDDFLSQERYALVSRLTRDVEKFVGKYTSSMGLFEYQHALASHRELHAALYQGVDFSLGSEDGNDAFNEDIIAAQELQNGLSNMLVERAYNQGRFAQICCAGVSAPRLCGLWTGEWNPGWRGAYTVDANVNLQVSGMNTGNVPDAALGYIYFLLRQILDWVNNAALSYGMSGALLPPVNTDGDRAPMVEYDQYYPFQYWNAGASWLILPIFEFWQCFGSRSIPVTATRATRAVKKIFWRVSVF